MKLILIIGLLFSCTSTSDFQEEYLRHFNRTELPFSIDRANIFEYKKIVFNKITETHHRSEYPILDSSNYKYIKTKDVDEIEYRCLYKFELSDDNWATIIIEDYIEDDEINEVWFVLYTYNRQGEIIETLLLGGYKIDYKEQFYSIDKELNISTELYEFLPPPDNDYDNIYAKKTTKKYKLLTTGKILKQEEIEEKEKFTITENGYKEIN